MLGVDRQGLKDGFEVVASGDLGGLERRQEDVSEGFEKTVWEDEDRQRQDWKHQFHL